VAVLKFKLSVVKLQHSVPIIVVFCFHSETVTVVPEAEIDESQLFLSHVHGVHVVMQC